MNDEITCPECGSELYELKQVKTAFDITDGKQKTQQFRQCVACKTHYVATWVETEVEA